MRAVQVNRGQKQAGERLLAVKMLYGAHVIIAQAAERRDLIKRVALWQAPQKAVGVGESKIEQCAMAKIMLVARGGHIRGLAGVSGGLHRVEKVQAVMRLVVQIPEKAGGENISRLQGGAETRDVVGRQAARLVLSGG